MKGIIYIWFDAQLEGVNLQSDGRWKHLGFREAVVFGQIGTDSLGHHIEIGLDLLSNSPPKKELLRAAKKCV